VELKNLDLELSRADGAAILRVRRASARNAIDRATMEELDWALDAVAASESARVLVVAGEGDGAFISGGDLRDFASLHTPELGRAMSARMSQVLDKLAALSIPSIAAVGYSAFGGGCEVALACDLRVMAEGASLVFSQVRMGLITGWGGGPRLVRLVGPSRAARILMTGAHVSAHEAQALGLADVAPAGLALAHALDLARQIARYPAGSVRALKQLVWACTDLPAADAQRLENRLFGERWGSPEHQRAVTEFLSRRAPANLDADP
jgi:enoyl-CoA hydratase